MIPYCILVIEDDGDRAFMENLYLSYNKLMYHEIFKITKDPWATEDIMQSTLVKLIDKISLLRSRDRNRQINYIISACKNTAFNYLRKEKNIAVFSFDDCMDSPSELSHDPIQMKYDTLDLQDDWECLHRIWLKLDDRSKFILEGRYILEKSPEEMALSLGIKPDSFRMALTRAKRNAKKLILDEYSKTY